MPAHAQDAPIARKGRIKQGLWMQNFGNLQGGGGPNAAPRPADAPEPWTLDMMCAEAVRLGVKGFDLVGRNQLPTLQAHGLQLICTNAGEMDFLTGLIHPEAHDQVEAALTATAAFCGANGVPGIALNAGQLRGLTYQQAADNAVEIGKRVGDVLAMNNAAIWIENVNDNRPGEGSLGREDMAFGDWEWGLEVVERVGSPGVKLLCDLYHLQIEDGDLAYTIRRDIQSIGHFHVAGVPTRAEIDETQEVNFRYVAEVIAGLDYDGYVSHEWRPSPGRDPLQSLARAIEIMDA